MNPQPAESVRRSGLPMLGTPAAVQSLAADQSDAQLVVRAMRGEQDAFAALVARYQKRVYWVAFHVVGRAEEARDVTQEAFVKLYQSLHRYDFARNFYTWFYRIVMNLAIDHLRKLRHGRSASLEDFPAGFADERDDPNPGEQREQDQLVWQAIDRLDPKFRAVLVLRDIHGVSCREIAPMLKVTHATVRWRLHRARIQFKEHWERTQRRGGER